MYSPIVALAGGQQLQCHSGFGTVLFPGFTGNFFYPGKKPEGRAFFMCDRSSLAPAGGRIDTCPPSCWRAAAGFRRLGCGTPTEPGPALPAGSPARSATHTGMFISCLSCMLGLASSAWQTSACLYFVDAVLIRRGLWLNMCNRSNKGSIWESRTGPDFGSIFFWFSLEHYEAFLFFLE